MANGARLSLLGMFNYDNTLFDGMTLPEEFDTDTKDILVANLLLECAELEVIYSSWDFLKMAIAAWSAKEVITWERLYQAMVAEYNPIENYNRTEDTNVQNRGAMTHSGTDSITGSGYDTDVGTGYNSDVGSGTDTVTNNVTSFDSNTYAPHDQTQAQKGSTITHNLNSTITHNKGSTDTTNYGHIITDSTGSHTLSNISGNIGVTTSQQMLEQEIELAPKLNVMNYIIDSFKNRFCLLVY